MKRLISLFSLCLLIAACTGSGTPEKTNDEDADDAEEVEDVMEEEDADDDDAMEAEEEEEGMEAGAGGPDGAMEAEEENGTEVKVDFEGKVNVESEARVIEMTVDDWSFTPATITAKKGEVVEIRLVGKDGMHSFAVPALSINTPVSAGETKTVMLPTGEAGTFEFLCRIPCGEGHKDMKGTITIE